jgi:hypothetical protein
MKRGTRGAAILATVVVAGSAGMAQAGDSIDAAMRENSPKVMHYLRAHGYGAVGVVRFSIEKGTRSESHHAGTLPDKMAARLENALALLNDPTAPIAIVTGSVPGSRGAGHEHGTSGRRSVFQHALPVAWGDQARKPDALLTGKILVRPDMKALSIAILAYEARRPDVAEEVLRIENVPTDRDVLASLGQSFVIPRRAIHRGARALDETAADDAANRDQSGANPLGDASDPVKLEILYDGKAVAITDDPASPGEAVVKRTKHADDPKEGVVATFKITNNGSDPVGVVLAVNGKNTILGEDLTSKAPGECTKWVLSPNQTYTIEGFYMSEDGKDVRHFKVLSDDDSAKSTEGGDRKGEIAVYAFRSSAGPNGADGMNIAADGGDLAQSPGGRGVRPRNLAEYQSALRTVNRTHAQGGKLMPDRSAPRPSRARVAHQKGGRGLLVGDDQGSSGATLNRVEQAFDPTPTMFVSIRYYPASSSPGPNPGSGDGGDKPGGAGK